MRFTPILIPAAILASCGGPADEAPAEPADVELTVSTTDEPMPVEPDGGIGDGVQPLDELQAQANVIPARFQGVWDYEGGTCARESDARMEISGREVLFYESVGTVTAVTQEETSTLVTLDMEGEGDTWVQTIRLEIKGDDDKERLHSTDGEKPAATDEYPSKRCDA
ncbi:MAG: hypothetical protein SXU28_02360 [Pseudomonadota bacterium]|nr:hypothetical protein [Pseudomonadota bacterium]